jgi:hypothetical protein
MSALDTDKLSRFALLGKLFFVSVAILAWFYLN